jgi:hypothetical protein
MLTLLSPGGMFEFYDLFMTGYITPGLVKAGMLTVVDYHPDRGSGGRRPGRGGVAACRDP